MNLRAEGWARRPCQLDRPTCIAGTARWSPRSSWPAGPTSSGPPRRCPAASARPSPSSAST